MVLAPLASAAGSGYNLSFSVGSSSGVQANVDLVSLTTSVSGSSQVAVSAQVAGQIVTNSADYFYYFYFGGTGAANSSAYYYLSDNATAGLFYSFVGGSYAAGNNPYTLSGGGSTITFDVNQSEVGSAGAFTANAEAVSLTGSGTGGSVTWLGSQNPNGGGGTCITVNDCTSLATAVNNAIAIWVYATVAIIVVVVVIVVVILVVVMRKKKTPPPMMAQPPYYAPGAAPMSPPGGTMPPPPPPPPQ
jgi:hypothetical protein